MKSRGISVYLDVKKNDLVKFDRPLKFKFTFDYFPKVDTTGNDKRKRATIKFKDKISSAYTYSGETSPGLYTSLYRKWYTPWVAEAYEEDQKIWEHDFEEGLYESKICVSIDSKSLGDTLAWLPVIDLFREKFNTKLYVTSFWNPLVSAMFPKIAFQPPGYRDPSTYATFGVGWYEEKDRNVHRRDPRSVSLQQVAGDILGINIDTDVLPPNIPQHVLNSEPTISGKYVCIATQSTANAKHWHFPGGWQTIVDYLNTIGYKVVIIQEQPNTLDNVIDKSGSIDIMERAVDIYHADFLIGLGSGLSWLAWALKKPVVMISGFSLPHCEFTEKNYRVINQSVCHGCFNDSAHKFDKGNWNWCPRLEGTNRAFECSTAITPQMVIDKIQDLISTEVL